MNPGEFCQWLGGFLDAFDENEGLAPSQIRRVRSELRATLQGEKRPNPVPSAFPPYPPGVRCLADLDAGPPPPPTTERKPLR